MSAKDTEVLFLADLTAGELDGLSRENTVFVQALSPLEVHGNHLPLGTDVFIAEEIRDRTVAVLAERHPELAVVFLPSAYSGSDTIPGSVDVNSLGLRLFLIAEGKMLAEKGFRYLLVTDNHGGPRHQIAIAKAARALWKRKGFHLAAPFLSFYRKMIELDPVLLAKTGTGRGSTGDLADVHAGLNETSLMLAAHPEMVRAGWESLPRTAIKERRFPALAADAAASVLRRLGAPRVAEDLSYVGRLLSWTTESGMPTYIGDPGRATAAAGEKVLAAFVDEALASVESALRGEPPFTEPLGWSLRFAG
ncbi:MAG: creatininase family protein [Candidatus Geothermincolia bacterium]